MSHAGAHVPHELTERPEHGEEAAPPSRSERTLELAAVVLLSLATLATAWSGYQAARWSGDQSQSYANASALRVKAQTEAIAAGQQRIDDRLLVDGWINAYQTGDKRLAEIYRSRFRGDLIPAFNAWFAQKPFDNPRAASSPLLVPQYRLAADARAAALDREADSRYKDGTDAKRNDDRYILSTVFFAAVLFFTGISLRLDWRPLRIVVLCAGGVMLLTALAFVVTLPVV